MTQLLNNFKNVILDSIEKNTIPAYAGIQILAGVYPRLRSRARMTKEWK